LIILIDPENFLAMVTASFSAMSEFGEPSTPTSILILSIILFRQQSIGELQIFTFLLYHI
jgi:hypothetical protein